MKKIIVVSLSLIVLAGQSFSQSISDIKSDQNSLYSRYCSCVNYNSEVDDLEECVRGLKNDANKLVGDIEDMIDEATDREAKDELKQLKIETQDFCYFLGSGSECLILFNKFISKCGGSREVVQEKNGVRLCKSIIGNFIYYYVYQISNTSLYTVKASFSYGNSSTSSEVGLLNEIDIIKKFPKTTPYKLASFSATVQSNLGSFPNSCNETFPRK